MRGKKPSRKTKRRSTTKVRDMSARQARSVKGGGTVGAGPAGGAGGSKKLIAPVRGAVNVEITAPDTRIVKNTVV